MKHIKQETIQHHNSVGYVRKIAEGLGVTAFIAAGAISILGTAFGVGVGLAKEDITIPPSTIYKGEGKFPAFPDRQEGYMFLIPRENSADAEQVNCGSAHKYMNPVQDVGRLVLCERPWYFTALDITVAKAPPS